jgi:hypothetical protein
MGIFRNNMEVNKTLAGFPVRFQELIDSLAEALGIQKDQQFTGKQIISQSDRGSIVAPLDGNAKVPVAHIISSTLPSPNVIPFPDNDGLLSGWSGPDGNPLLVSSAKADLALPAAGGQVTWTQDSGSDFQLVWSSGLYIATGGTYILFVSGTASKISVNDDDMLHLAVNLTDKYGSRPYNVETGAKAMVSGQKACYAELMILAPMTSGNSLSVNVSATNSDNQIYFTGYAVALKF